MNYDVRRRWLFSLLLLSLALLVLGTTLRLDPVFGVALSCAPLVYYHVLLSRCPAADLSASEVDSVYYFGFLVTIASLAAGVYVFQVGDGQRTTEDVPSLLRQFAVGIVATAYAVFARMHLQSRRAFSDSADPSEKLSELVFRNQELIAQMVAAADVAAQLTQHLAHARDRIPRQAAEELASALAAIRSEFADGLADTLATLDGAAGRLRESLDAVAAVSTAGGLDHSLQRLVTSVRSLSEGTSAAADASLEAAAAVSMASKEFTALHAVVQSGQTELQSLSSTGTQLRAWDAAVAHSTRSLSQSSHELVRITAEMSSVGENISTAPRTMKRLVDQLERSAEGMDYLASVAAKLGAAAGDISRAAAAAEALVQGVERVNEIGPRAAASFEAVTKASADTSRGFGTLTQSLGGTEKALREHQQAASRVEAASSGLTSVGDASHELAETISRLSGSLVAAEKDLLAAATGVRNASQSASATLARDLEAATRSAVTVSERLVTLVNSIIEQTNRQRVRN